MSKMGATAMKFKIISGGQTGVVSEWVSEGRTILVGIE